MLLTPAINWKAGDLSKLKARTARANNRETLTLPIKKFKKKKTEIRENSALGELVINPH